MHLVITAVLSDFNDFISHITFKYTAKHPLSLYCMCIHIHLLVLFICRITSGPLAGLIGR